MACILGRLVVVMSDDTFILVYVAFTIMSLRFFKSLIDQDVVTCSTTYVAYHLLLYFYQS